jgi:hypothetical protein
MFFIGIFGIDHAVRDTGTTHTVVCPACGAWTQLQPQKEYDYFHIFFIPLFRWNICETARADCCGAQLERSGDS